MTKVLRSIADKIQEENMLKKFEALEKFLNNILLALIEVWIKLMHLVLPKKVFVFKDQGFEKLSTYRQKCKEFVFIKAQAIKDICIKLFMQTMDFAQKFSFVEYQTRLTSKLEKLKTYWKETTLKQKFLFLRDLIKKLKFKLGTFEPFTPTQISITTVSLVLLLGGALGIYYSSKTILDQEYGLRAPASVQEYDLQPAYAQYSRKTLKVLNMKVPISVENVAAVSSITIDFSVRTSTRFARYFLENYEYKLKDYFFSTVEPVISDFPLEEEGKQILKEKIIFEINNFLRENRVEGVVEDVRILFIVAS